MDKMLLADTKKGEPYGNEVLPKLWHAAFAGGRGHQRRRQQERGILRLLLQRRSIYQRLHDGRDDRVLFQVRGRVQQEHGQEPNPRTIQGGT